MLSRRQFLHRTSHATGFALATFNLAALPRYAGELTRLRAELERWQKETGDLGLVPELELRERMRRHPLGWRYAELARLLRRAGFREASRRGSHRRWKHSMGISVTLVDAPGHVRPEYVRETVAAIARARGAA